MNAFNKSYFTFVIKSYFTFFPQITFHAFKEDIWVKFLTPYKAWKWCHIFRIFGRPFWQFRGLKSREMKYILKIYLRPIVEMPLFQPYQSFIKHYLVKKYVLSHFSLNDAILKVDMVKMEASLQWGATVY